MKTKRGEPLAVAQKVLVERHPDVRAAWLCGSVLTDRRTPYSDLDIVVLLDGSPAPYRESLQAGGWPVELFVHTDASWHAFVDKEVARRSSPLLFMTARGVPITDADGSGVELQAEARRRWAAGPKLATAEQIDDLRYGVSDLLDNLAGCTDSGELLFITAELARRAAEAVLLASDTWGGGGKQLARRVEHVMPGLAERLHSGVRRALDGERQELMAVIDEVLEPLGGRLWTGYRRAGLP